MKRFQSNQSVLVKLLSAAFVVAALSTVVHVTKGASSEAVATKQAEFQAAEAIQTAAKERKGHAVASAK